MVGLAIDAVEEHNGDSVLDVEVPSNRPDCLSHIGIAREVAVIEKGRVALAGRQAAENRRSGRRSSLQLKSTILISVRVTPRDWCAV